MNDGSNVVIAFHDWRLVTQEDEKDLEEEEEEEVDVGPTDPADDSNGSWHSTDAGSDEMEMGPEYSADEDILDYDQKELSHEMAFSLHKRLSCFTHTLQLVVCKFNTLTLLKKVIQSAHRFVAKLSKSVKATEKLVALCGKKLMSDCLTRWNSTFLMILHMLEVRPHVSCYVCSTQSMLKQLSWIQGSRLYSPPTSWKLQTAIATGCKSLKFLPHCVCIIYIYPCVCVCDQEAFSIVSLLHRRQNQGGTGGTCPPKI